jgi:hypothetical protein
VQLTRAEMRQQASNPQPVSEDDLARHGLNVYKYVNLQHVPVPRRHLSLSVTKKMAGRPVRLLAKKQTLGQIMLHTQYVIKSVYFNMVKEGQVFGEPGRVGFNYSY